MAKSPRDHKYIFIIIPFLEFVLVITAVRGIQAEKDVCPHEETQLSCPNLEPERGKNGYYEELYWTVTDPYEKDNKRHLVHCNEHLNCTRYSKIGDFSARIKIGNFSRGKLNVTLTEKKDLLTFTCEIHRKQNKPTLADPRNVSSSVNCLSLVAGQDVNLNQALGELPSPETIEDTVWYWIKHNEEEQKIVHCHTSCQFIDCNNSICPQFWERLKINGTKLMLTNVGDVDRGLKLKCRMYRRTVGKTKDDILKIQHVSPSESFSSASHSKNSKTPSPTPLQTPSQTSLPPPSQPPSPTPSQTPSPTPLNRPSRSSTAWVHGTRSSAGGRVLEFIAVFVSLVIALFELS